jgi:hypothetical protein
MAVAPRSANIVVRRAFDWHEAAAHCGFTAATFRAWVRHKLLPSASPATDHWDPQELSAALHRLSRDGHREREQIATRWAAYVPLPNVHRVRRTQSDGTKKYHYFRRNVLGRLTGEPGGAAFMRDLIAKEREFTSRQIKNKLEVYEASAANDIPLSPVQTGEIGPTATKLGRDRAVRSPSPSQGLPLYPDEKQIAIAILGPQRAQEWKAKAALLEREGLPPIDTLMGGRSWVAVQRFFATRDGLDRVTPPESNSPDTRRVRYVPFVPDGRERSHAKEETAVTRRRDERRT